MELLLLSCNTKNHLVVYKEINSGSFKNVTYKVIYEQTEFDLK